MLRATFFVCVSWQPLLPHVFSATRMSPGLMKRTNSQLSRASNVLVRSGFAPVYLPFRFHSSGKRGCTWAARLTRSISPWSSLVFRGTGLPPWQVVQVRRKASLPSLSSFSRVAVGPYLCIGSICEWQEMQPSNLGAAADGSWLPTRNNLVELREAC